MPTLPPLPPTGSRRLLLLRSSQLLAAAAAAWLQPARAQGGALRPTPRQAEGPFYPLELPKDSDFDLLKNGSLNYQPSEVAVIEGVVTDTQGRPLNRAVVEIWQCDERGKYHHPADGNRADPAFQGFGRVTTGPDGAYRFRTMRPARYAGRTPHIHVKVKHEGRDLLTTQFYVEGDPGNLRDGLWRRLDDQERAELTKPFVPGPEGLRAVFPIVVRT